MIEEQLNSNAHLSNKSSNPKEHLSQAQIELHGNSLTNERIKELEENMILNNSDSFQITSFEPSIDNVINNTQKNFSQNKESDSISGKKNILFISI